MNIAHVFSLLLIALMGCASVAWTFAGDYRQAVYWLSGAVLNIAVLTMAVK